MEFQTHTEDAKNIIREKLQVALDNLKQAELEGAEQFAPDTFTWAKNKIYEDRKLMLKNVRNKKLLEEASDDASAAAAQLLTAVRTEKEKFTEGKTEKERTTKDAIKNLVNEGGPVQ